MTTFEYRCGAHGLFEVGQRVGAAQPQWPCPVCHQDSTRVFTAPMLSLASRALMAVIDSAERTRDDPAVVCAVPAAGARRRQRMAPPNPALQRLPRP